VDHNEYHERHIQFAGFADGFEFGDSKSVLAAEIMSE
jgi:hypothetical protein